MNHKVSWKEISCGDGIKIETGDQIILHYTASDEKNRKIADSYVQNNPLIFQYGSGYVIKELEEGIRGMRIGDIRTLELSRQNKIIWKQLEPEIFNDIIYLTIELIDLKRT
ncbi:MAG: FKBP-type peptidyl-prolyl cis-trans isomerase [Candidatus Cloacimonetes bacterium]|nr:FKBP-type peptidyl-prolyl cis-trans isomerase [Candidatus Cloacimonadota bacterium]